MCAPAAASPPSTWSTGAWPTKAMDDRQFDIQVDGTTKEEYLEASREMVLGMLPTGIVLVTIVTVCILLLMETVTVGAIVAPYLVLALALMGGLLYVRSQWKKFPADMSYSYLIDAEGWQLTVGDSYGGANWDETPKMTERSKVLLFYQRNSSASSTLPKRCLTGEQLEAIRGWYQASRADFKAKDKAMFQQERQARKANRPRRRW